MLLKKGDNNEQVKQLQVKLHLDPVGNFGPKTEVTKVKNVTAKAKEVVAEVETKVKKATANKATKTTKK